MNTAATISARVQGSTLDCVRDGARLEALCAAVSANPDREIEAFLKEAALAAADLPGQLDQALRDFRLNGNRDGFLLLRGLPMARPHDAETYLALVGSRIGDFAGYAQEKNGAIFHDIVPERAQENEQSAAGSKTPLALHTERCFHPHLPGHVLLFCMRPDAEGLALTQIASMRRMMARIPSRHLPTLFEPVFRTGIDYSFGNLATEKGNGPVLPVLYGDRDDPCLRYDLDLMVGLNTRARAALAAIQRAAERSRIDVGLAAGDLLIIDNRRAVHGRTAFTARYDGRDRWLKRAYLVGELPESGPDRLPGERVIRTRF